MPLERNIAAFEAEVEILATLDVGTLWDRMLGEFLGEWGRLERQGLSSAEMAGEMRGFMDGLSPKQLEDLARTSAGVSYNQGRSAEILSAHVQGLTQFVVRSEVLDAKTCEVCAQLDGSVFEIGTRDYEEFLPPAKCLGGDRCRGFYVAVGSGGEA